MFHCNCKWTETIIGVVILVVTLWPNLLGASVSWWLTVIAAAILILHAWRCSGVCMPREMSMQAARRKRR